MNSGVFGMASGQAGAARKLAGRVGSGTTSNASQRVESILTSGAHAQSASLSAGVRTKLLSANGRGALRWFGHVHATGTNYRYEIVVDGVAVIDITMTGSGGGAGPVVWGSVASYTVSGTATRSGAIYDYLPFDSSLEVYVTATAAPGAETYGYILDMHQ